MTIFEWLVENIQKLKEADVDSPRRDCLVLLEDTLGKDRAWVISHPEYQLESHSLQPLSKMVGRRLKREPLAYIRRKAWFYGRFFCVTPDVMIPRPESEAFIEIIKLLKPDELVDLGTGSGCLAITAKLECPDCSVFAYDISPKALKIAKENASNLGVNIVFNTSDLLKNVNAANVMCANLPYVPDGFVTSQEIGYEPAVALFSGDDGLTHYRKFWNEVANSSLKPQHILTESLEEQHSAINIMAKKSGYVLKQTKVLVQHFEKTTSS